MTTLSSDPHAWLRPYFATLRQRPTFGLLSPSHQFADLCTAIEAEHPTRAAAMREWTPAAQDGLLKWLTDITNQERASPAAELWTVRKDGRELQCLAVYLPTGIDVRVMEWPDFRRTQLVKTGPEAEALARGWRAKLLEVGWCESSTETRSG